VLGLRRCVACGAGGWRASALRVDVVGATVDDHDVALAPVLLEPVFRGFGGAPAVMLAHEWLAGSVDPERPVPVLADGRSPERGGAGGAREERHDAIGGVV